MPLSLDLDGKKVTIESITELREVLAAAKVLKHEKASLTVAGSIDDVQAYFPGTTMSGQRGARGKATGRSPKLSPGAMSQLAADYKGDQTDDAYKAHLKTSGFNLNGGHALTAFKAALKGEPTPKKGRRKKSS